ncbi:hypothetical protein BKA62DRAFT_673090 [Auriculariales sp. MPI-PUGE-AT-0066]|nr:hypothetical protein BKA62DRAFT_673090 [Auriculariales sp. MPI-PUGE-AT-0066]
MASGIPTRMNAKPRTIPARATSISKPTGLPSLNTLPKRASNAVQEIDIGSPTTVVSGLPKFATTRASGKSSESVVSQRVPTTPSSANPFYVSMQDGASVASSRQRVTSMVNTPSSREGSVVHRRGQSVSVSVSADSVTVSGSTHDHKTRQSTTPTSAAPSISPIRREPETMNNGNHKTPSKPRPKSTFVDPNTPRSSAQRTPQHKTPSGASRAGGYKASPRGDRTPPGPADLLPGVPWSDLGSSTRPAVQPICVTDHRPFWAGTADESDGLDLITVDEADADDDFIQALENINNVHLDKVTHYKRLLERAQSANAAQLHALQAELRMVRGELQGATEARAPQLTLDTHFASNNNARDESFYQDVDLAMAIRGDGRGNFNETEVKKAVRSLKQPDRMRLLSIILDSLIPGDISQQIHLLEKYAKSTFDIISTLPVPLALRVLSFLSPRDLLKGTRLVSQGHCNLSRHPALWRLHCLRLTSRDPVSVRAPKTEEGWEPLYRSLYYREENWRRGVVQGVRFLQGHTGFVTSLILRGKRLISGSYDETIRVWDVESGEERKCLQLKKPVSCIDFLTEEEVFVVGFHDVGRVHVFSSVTYTPLQQLQGHLYGIRAVALSSKYCVSAGADKALVVWDWRAGTKVVRFGQQTNLNVGVQIVNADRFASVTIDGIVRVFSIGRREMISQFKLSEMCAELGLGRAPSCVGVGANNMLQWFAAKGSRMTCATKNVILHLEWDEEDIKETSEPLSRNRAATIVASPSVPVPSPSPAGLRNLAATPGPGSAVGGNRIRSGSKAGLTPLSRSSMGPNTPLRQSTAGAMHMGIPSPVTPGNPQHLRASTGGPMTPRTPGTPDGAFVLPSAKISNVVKPPRIVSVVESPEVAVGAVDPAKRRVITATRFSSRAGADRRIFVSTHREKQELGQKMAAVLEDAEGEDETDSEDGRARSVASSAPSGDSEVDRDTAITTLSGAWAALAEEIAPGTVVPGLKGAVPPAFKGFATPEKNPMSMQLSHEEVVVGCGDGTIYVMSFVGHAYALPRSEEVQAYLSVADGSDTE